jgi:DNA-binding GntR family transcriptional regulator
MERPMRQTIRINQTAQGAIVQELRKRILTGALAPGTPLRQGEIAKVLGVSTTPVREGLRELIVEGLVDGDPHRGMWVHTPTATEVDEVYRIIEPLEQMAMRAAAAEITRHEIEEADRLLDEMDADVDTPTWVDMNLRFHALLMESARMPVLASTLRRLRNLSALYVAGSLASSADLITNARGEHRHLLAALRGGSADLAAQIAAQHLAATRAARVRYAARQDHKGG